MKLYHMYLLAGKEKFFKKIQKAEKIFRQTFPNQPQNIKIQFFEDNMLHINGLLNLPANHHNMQGFPKNYDN